MKKVEIQITQTFEERPIDVLNFLIGNTLKSIYTLNAAIGIDLLSKSTANDAVHQKLFFKTSDGFIYKMTSEEYIEDYYFDIKKNAIEMTQQIEEGFVETELSMGFFIKKIYIFSLQYELSPEKWHIENIYNEKWHNKKRNIKFKEEFYPDVYIRKTSEDSHLVFSNEKGEYLSIGTQLSPYFTITTNKPYIDSLLFTGDIWIKRGDENPYALSRTIE